MKAFLPPFPRVSDYAPGTELRAFLRGKGAAYRYYRELEQGKSVQLSDYIERADARDEPMAWYDGFDSVANPEYFAPSGK